MEITQDSIVSALLEAGGQLKNSEMLSKFRSALNSSDPAEKKQNRDLFKTFVNNVAVVKELEDSKYIVLKKKYQHLLKNKGEEEEEEKKASEEVLEEGEKPEREEKENRRERKENNREEEKRGERKENSREEEKRGEHKENSREEEKRGERKENSREEEKRGEHKENRGGSEGGDGERSGQDASHSGTKEEASEEEEAPRSPVALALERNKTVDLKVKRSMQFTMPLKPSAEETQKNPVKTESKPFALPLRMPQVVITRPPKVEKPPANHVAPVSFTLGPPSSPRYKRRASTDSVASVNANVHQPRRQCKSAKQVDEPRYGEVFPLDLEEHQWLVTSAAGRWGLVYGLLLKDTTLAERKDFISGFTALHWAAKCGNEDMVHKIVKLSREYGKGVDINAKSFAGYTPLHIAAIHGQEKVLHLLVQYGANCNLRDNSGKKAYQYLGAGASPEIRNLMGAPKATAVQMENHKELGDSEAHKHLPSISRLFQPNPMGLKKKPKARSSVLSVAEEGRDEREEHVKTLHRVWSDVFT